MNKLRLILIIWSIFSLIGIFWTINTRDNVSGRSSGSEQLFAKALQTIDSIFVADDDNPQRYEKFKKSTSSLGLYDMESECYRMAVSNDQRWKEEYYCRGIIERYRPEMPPSDKIRIIRVLNNMGCIYNEKNNPAAAYIFLKTGYEMAKKFDAIKESHPAFLCNLANIYSYYSDDQTANSPYREAIDMAYSPDFKPGDARKLDAAKIHTFIEYIHYAWASDRLDSAINGYDEYAMKLHDSASEYFPYARNLSLATTARINKEYGKAA